MTLTHGRLQRWLHQLHLHVFPFLQLLVLPELSLQPVSGSGAEKPAVHGEGRNSSASQHRLSVLLISSFYSGHIIPLLAVGEELVRRGHTVSFFTTKINGSNLIPDVPIEIGMHFINAGSDPRSKLDYERAIYGCMGKSPARQMSEVFSLLRDHSQPLLAACDRLNMSQWDVIVADVILLHLIRYVDLKWSVKIVLSVPVAADYVSMEPPWPNPSKQCVSCKEDMSFWQRFVNTFFYKNPLLGYFSASWMKHFLSGNNDVLWNLLSQDPYLNFFPDEVYPTLVYTAIGVEYAVAHLPNVHFVGPVLRQNGSTLEPALVDWLSTKKSGKVIYISMGTTARVSRSMAESFVQGIQATDFSAVWSLRESNQDSLEDLSIDSSRFYIAQWVSQVAILEHPAVGMSILHCGTGGVHEALFHRVPIICIPFWYDQFSWAIRIRDQGLGLAMLADEVSTQQVMESIHKIESGGYKERVSRMSKILKKAGGSCKAADLVEFYAEVGYDHLKPAYVKYQWSSVQYYNLDVYAVTVLVIIIAGWTLWIVERKLNFYRNTKTKQE